MKISFLFAWYDLWVGFFWDRKNKWLYILPIPCFGVILKFKNYENRNRKNSRRTPREAN